MNDPEKRGDQVDGAYSSEEAQRRFEKLVWTALNTPPKPMKDMPRKRLVSRSKQPEGVAQRCPKALIKDQPT